MGKTRPERMEAISTGWADMVLVCRSCGDDGFGPKGRDRLRAALRAELREAGLRRRIGVLDVACFGICPKQAVTTALASRPGQLLVVPEGDLARNVLETLGVYLDLGRAAAAAPRDNVAIGADNEA